MEMNNDLHNIFCSWRSKLEELSEYFQDKYNIDFDDNDVKATKETIMEMATDVPKIVSIALYGKDVTKEKKIIVEPEIERKERQVIFVSDKNAAKEIAKEIKDYACKYGEVNTYDIEEIVMHTTGVHKFALKDYDEYNITQACSISIQDTVDGCCIIFPETDDFHMEGKQ